MFTCFGFISVVPSLIPLTTGIDLNLRHGALLATAEISHALSMLAAQNGQTIGDILDADTLDGMKAITRKASMGCLIQSSLPLLFKLSSQTVRFVCSKMLRQTSLK